MATQLTAVPQLGLSCPLFSLTISSASIDLGQTLIAYLWPIIYLLSSYRSWSRCGHKPPSLTSFSSKKMKHGVEDVLALFTLVRATSLLPGSFLVEKAFGGQGNQHWGSEPTSCFVVLTRRHTVLNSLRYGKRQALTLPISADMEAWMPPPQETSSKMCVCSPEGVILCGRRHQARGDPGPQSI